MWIGISAAAGEQVDIPIITWYLASHVWQGDSECCIDDMDLLVSLDAGNHPSHPTGTVKAYHASWWSGKVPPDSMQTMNNGIIEECLRYHQTQCDSILKTCQQVAPPNAVLPCCPCTLYRGVALDALHDLHTVHNTMQGREAAFDNQCWLTARRASAFYSLYETALLKESLNPEAGYVSALPAVPAAAAAQMATTLAGYSGCPTRRSRAKAREQAALTNQQLAELLQQHFEAEHNHYGQHPSLKWTWGVNVDASNIRDMY